jgi:hypothetical protein
MRRDTSAGEIHEQGEPFSFFTPVRWCVATHPSSGNIAEKVLSVNAATARSCVTFATRPVTFRSHCNVAFDRIGIHTASTARAKPSRTTLPGLQKHSTSSRLLDFKNARMAEEAKSNLNATTHSKPEIRTATPRQRTRARRSRGASSKFGESTHRFVQGYSSTLPNIEQEEYILTA